MSSIDWQNKWNKLNDDLITVSASISALLGVGAGITATNALVGMASATKSMVVTGASLAALGTMAGAGYLSMKLSEKYINNEQNKEIQKRVNDFLKICPQYKGQEEALKDWDRIQLFMDKSFTLESITECGTALMKSMIKNGDDFEMPFAGQTINDIKIMEQEEPYSVLQFQNINCYIAEKNALKNILELDDSKDKQLYSFVKKVHTAEHTNFVPVKDWLDLNEKAILYEFYKDNNESLQFNSVNLCNRKMVSQMQTTLHDFNCNSLQEIFIPNKYLDVKNEDVRHLLSFPPRKEIEINFGGQSYCIKDAKIKSLENDTCRIVFTPKNCSIDTIAKYRFDYDKFSDVGHKKASPFVLFALNFETNQVLQNKSVGFNNNSKTIEIGLSDCNGKLLKHGDILFDRIDGTIGVIDASKDKIAFGDIPTFIDLYNMKEKPINSPFSVRCQRICSLYEIEDKAYGYLKPLREAGKDKNLDEIYQRIDIKELEMRDKPIGKLGKPLVQHNEQVNEQVK